MAKQKRKSTAYHAKGVGKGNRNAVPPAEHQWKPGQSGNPAGCPKAGATVVQWYNVLAAKNLNREQIRQIADDPATDYAKCVAAQSMLISMEVGDLANYQPYLDGLASLGDLRDSGIDTRVVKKAEVRVLKTLESGDQIISRKVELHDRRGTDLDRVMDRTVGKPNQEITQHVDGTLRTQSDGEAAADTLLARIAARLGIDAARPDGDAGPA